MTENLIPQTLYAALEFEKSFDQCAMLLPATAALTRENLLNIIHSRQWGSLPPEVIANLKELSILRIKKGQSLFPWNDAAFLAAIIDELFDIDMY